MGAVQFNDSTRGYAHTLAPAGKFPIVGDRIFDTLQAAQDYVDGNGESKTAIPGIYLSVIDDGDNNGAYWVAQAAGYGDATSGILKKMGEGGGGTGGGGIDSIEFSLASDTTYAVSLTINNERQNITAATLRSSLNVLGKSENAASATKLNDNTAYTIWGNTFFSNGKPANVSNHLYMSNGKAIYFADSGGSNRMVVQVNTSNRTIIGQGTTSTGYDTYLYGHNLALLTNYGNKTAMYITTAGKVGIGKTNPAVALDVDGVINSTNFVQGGSLASDPTSSFQTTCFGGTSSSYRLKVMRPGNALYDGVASKYGTFLALASSDTNGYISFPAYAANKSLVFIGGGMGDKIDWKAKLFHDGMSLLPDADNTYIIGSTSQRYKSMVVADSVQIGDAVLVWDSASQMLKITKGVYSTGAITAGAK